MNQVINHKASIAPDSKFLKHTKQGAPMIFGYGVYFDEISIPVFSVSAKNSKRGHIVSKKFKERVKS